jgi:pyridinium-3,5-biscarboxylic acid mononucleotide synthase
MSDSGTSGRRRIQSQRKNFVDAVVTVSYNSMLPVPTRRRSTSRAVERTKRGRLLKTPPDASGSIATLQTHLLRKLLEDIHHQRTTPEEGLEVLRHLPYEDLGFAQIDHHRGLRQGFPEVVFCQGKTVEQVCQIVQRIRATGSEVLATRASQRVFAAVQDVFPEAVYHAQGRTIVVRSGERQRTKGMVLVVSAGTSDIPVAEEAAITAETLGSTTERLYDVGVAGIHRLLDRREKLFQARVLIVVAGMEGALASVVGGLVDKPVIAVPTSIGYGASLGGIAALLTMLNSCAAGIATVNIDNGFGAGYIAHSINVLGESEARG